MSLDSYKKNPGLIFKTKAAAMVLLIVAGTTIAACSAVSGQNVTKQEKQTAVDPAVKTFSFYETESGKPVKWDVEYKNGKIKSVYRNGEKMPSVEADSIKEKIADNLSDIDHASGLTFFRFPDINFDSTFNSHRTKRMRINFSGFPGDSSCFVFNDKHFKMDMKKLHKDLDKLKHMKIDIDFDSAGFCSDMEELGKNLSKMKIDVRVPDMSKFHSDMRRFRREMRDFNFREGHGLDMSNLHKKMDKLKESMKDLKIKMKGLDKKLEKLKNFMSDVRDELVKDKVIKSRDEDFSMVLSKDEFIINDKKQSDTMRDKYLKIYEKDFGKPLDHEMNLRTK